MNGRLTNFEKYNIDYTIAHISTNIHVPILANCSTGLSRVVRKSKAFISYGPGNSYILYPAEHHTYESEIFSDMNDLKHPQLEDMI